MASTVSPAYFTFAVYPVSLEEDQFSSFLLDVPSLDPEAEGAEDRAARRAWWSAFHQLGPRGIEPEEFAVCCWRDNSPGPPVGSGGIIQ